MGLKDLQLKLKGFQLRRLLVGNKAGSKRRETANIEKKPSWMMPAVSHGYYTIDEGFSSRRSFHEPDSDYVVAQREQIEELELWFFGVFNAQIGDGVTKYMQAHLFDKKPKESQIKGKSNDIMKKAYLGARAKTRETHGAEETHGVGSVSAMVIGGEKLVMANMGDYRAVVCRDGLAHQIGSRHNPSTKLQNPLAKRHWSQRFIKGKAAGTKLSKGSDLVFGAERIDPDTEFVILASSVIWEVMKNQEAVNLIKHIENPQAAAECLANEASTRMSRSSISCLVIRFD